ncbi:MAG: hypothetical protein M1828_001790 [Chrysothrix sp. TS-e1954]|nr:MAG: hypothetical protein M1828_001790 [Chrysothrix sp. TS-e1954]
MSITFNLAKVINQSVVLKSGVNTYTETGMYTLRDDMIMGAVATHPAELHTPSTNVLDTKPIPPTAGTQLSVIIVAPTLSSPRPKPSGAHHVAKSSIPTSISEIPHDSSQPGSELGPNSLTNLASGNLRAFVFGDGSASASQTGVKDSKEVLKRRKPKSSMTKSGSSFVSRVVTQDGLSKRLQERAADGIMIFANTSRSLQWLDLSAQKKTDPLTKVLFTRAHPLCHEANQATKHTSHLDVILGFSTADIMWYEPFSQKYTRINKNGMVNPTPAARIKWVPGSENLFVAAHFDGQLVVYDKDRDDASIIAEEEHLDSSLNIDQFSKRQPRIQVKKSLLSTNQKTNPVAVWKLSKQRINDLSFSPDGRFLATAAEDGCLRVMDFAKETLLDLYSSYYGGLTCVSWSPDGRYILTGGQDDLVSIWSFEDRALVARCVGHRSWVSAVSFDAWRCDGRSYRFGSVGEDCRLILWDFSEGMLHRPRAVSFQIVFSARGAVPDTVYKASIRPSMSSYAAPGNHEAPLHANLSLVDNERNGVESNGADPQDDISHAIEPRAHVSMLPPVMSKEVDDHALSWIGFEEDCIMTACRGGHIRVWNRP